MVDLALLAPEKPRRIKREEYQALIERGFFDEQRVELLDGVIVEMAPGYPEHASPIQVLNEFLVPRLVGRAHVRIQLDYLARGDSQPVPDLAIVPLGSYRYEHPDRAHAVMEVAYSSVRKDRLVKAPLYAASNVLEYWVFNVPEECVEVFRDSDGEAYRTLSRHDRNESPSLLAFPDVSVPLAAVFG
jgi:Uma2 family endonuclease